MCYFHLEKFMYFFALKNAMTLDQFINPKVANSDFCTFLLLCIGEESFEHANVLSEKINFSALGGPGVAIFGPDDLHPMC